MSNVQDISSQLMKSPRELASWSFPLSQILEEYFNLLPSPSKIHYGEAALVIQNSVNAYVRRVEELYDKTKFLTQKLIVQSMDDEEIRYQRERDLNKSRLSIRQFEQIDFDKEIGNNINLRNREKKSLKFLHRSFSKLENYHSRFRVEVFDIQGDAIGKKYDYRCNQRMTQTGALVEEFSKNDFNGDVIFGSHTNLLSTISKKNPDINVPSEYYYTQSNVDHDNEDCESIDVATVEKITRDLINVFDESTANCRSPIRDSGIFSLDIIKNFISSTENIESSLTERCTSSTGIDASNDSINETDSDEASSSSDKNTDSKDYQNLHFQNDTYKRHMNNYAGIQNYENELVSAVYNVDVHKQEIINNITVNNCKREDDKIKSNLKRKISQNDIHESELSPDDANSMLRRSKRIKNIDNNYTFNKIEQLSPIPFNGGIPEKLPKCRKEFRLPCHINLLKHTAQSRKNIRGKTSRLKKCRRERFKNYIYNDVQNTKAVSYSLKQKIVGDNKGFGRPLDESFIFESSSVSNFEPVTALTMDLLGFHPNFAQNDLQNNHSENVSIDSITSSPVCTSPFLTPYNLTTAASPPSLHALLSPNQDKNENKMMYTKSGCNFEKLIKHKIKKIYEELDLQADEDQNVSRWHEEIKPRLIEVERKPPFRIHEYEYRIIQKLETCERKLQFDEIVRKESPYEVARYFSATLQLASTNNLNINTSEDIKKGIELILLD